MTSLPVSSSCTYAPLSGVEVCRDLKNGWRIFKKPKDIAIKSRFCLIVHKGLTYSNGYCVFVSTKSTWMLYDFSIHTSGSVTFQHLIIEMFLQCWRLWECVHFLICACIFEHLNIFSNTRILECPTGFIISVFIYVFTSNLNEWSLYEMYCITKYSLWWFPFLVFRNVCKR